LKQIIKFALIGTIGFLVDAIILLLCFYLLTFSIEFSRLISFLFAVFVTWILNRKFTFSSYKNRTKKKEYSLYFFMQALGVLINYSIFLFLIYINEFFKEYIIIPLAIASLIVMFFNYFISKKVVFKN